MSDELDKLKEREKELEKEIRILRSQHERLEASWNHTENMYEARLKMVSRLVSEYEQEKAERRRIMEREEECRIRGRLNEYDAYQQGLLETTSIIMHNMGNAITGLLNRVEQLQGGADAVKNVAKAMGGYLEKPVSHDVNALRDILSASSEALLSSANDKCVSNIKSIRAVVEHIVDVIRIQQASVKPEQGSSSFAVGEIIADAQTILGGMSGVDGVKITVQNKHPDLRVYAPRNQTLQALVNVLKNSIEACNQFVSDKEWSAKVDVTVTCCDSNMLSVVVADNGVGIEPDIIERVIKYGFTTKPRGTGIGLHSAYILLNSIGGQFSIESDGVGQGTSVALTLPVDV